MTNPGVLRRATRKERPAMRVDPPRKPGNQPVASIYAERYRKRGQPVANMRKT